jgi:imidazolonepropionase-like amidohydrolase
MFAIKTARAFDGEQQLPGGATLLIDDGRIAGIAPAAAPLPESCAVVEFPHATVLPGLIDTHVPLGGDGRDGADVGRTHRAGVKIVTGTDGGISTAKPHGIVSTGISMLVASGISAADALASATSIAAQVCGLGSCKGRLRTGYDAGLLFVDGDPLSDIGALSRPAAVMVRGRWAIQSAAERTGLGQP